MSGRFKRGVLAAVLLLGRHVLSAQEETFKDGAILYTMGAGYEWMSDAYSPKGMALDLRTRFYASERMFYVLNLHWGLHDGEKSVMQQGKPFAVGDQRNCLFGAVGAGYEWWQSDNRRFDVYTHGLLGYGVRTAEYDDYRPAGAGNRVVMFGCEKNRKGVAAVVGTGLDSRFKCWVISPSVEVVYQAGRWDIACMLSFGFYAYY